MELLQTFETTVTTAESAHLALHALFVSARLSESECTDGHALADALGARSWSPAAPEEVPVFIALMLEQEAFAMVPAGSGSGFEVKGGRPVDAEIQDSRSLEFATEVFQASIIPMTQSPLTTKALSGLFSVGATVGYMVVEQHHPMLLFIVPFGIIICGAAAGVSEALHEGLRAKILDWLRIPTHRR